MTNLEEFTPKFGASVLIIATAETEPRPVLSRRLALLLAAVGGLIAANLYYAQPLLIGIIAPMPRIWFPRRCAGASSAC
ncbi:hypothetical protein P7L64_05335 [Tistrella bauzanensis]|uniref:hypothetical protein n=1 Tax=Tistrella bauzanensis TaxID=657419 RepID=UPI00355664B0